MLQSLDTLDNGKPFTSAYHDEMTISSKCLRYFASLCDKVVGQTIPVGTLIIPRRIQGFNG